MESYVREIFQAKKIKVTTEEMAMLTHQWSVIQQLKGNFKNEMSGDYDIALTHDLGGVFHE